MGEILPSRREQVLEVTPTPCVPTGPLGRVLGAQQSQKAGCPMSHMDSPRRKSI